MKPLALLISDLKFEKSGFMPFIMQMRLPSFKTRLGGLLKALISVISFFYNF
jgi:hypothetical protein